MISQLEIWGVNLVLCGIISISFCLYAVTFRRVAGLSITSLSGALRFAYAVLTDPFFIGGLALALGGSVLRIALMRWLGIARTAIASEVTVLITLVMAYFFFGSKLRFPHDYIGAIFILVGSYLVTR